MTKNLKLNIKNAQIANAVNLSGLKDKLASKKATEEQLEEKSTLKEVSSKESGLSAAPSGSSKKGKSVVETQPIAAELEAEAAPRVKARSRSAFAESTTGAKKEAIQESTEASVEEVSFKAPEIEESFVMEQESDLNDFSSESKNASRRKTNEELRKEIFGEEIEAQQREQTALPSKNALIESSVDEPSVQHKDLDHSHSHKQKEVISSDKLQRDMKPQVEQPVVQKTAKSETFKSSVSSPLPTRPNLPPKKPLPLLPKLELRPVVPREFAAPVHKLGPTGKHIKDLIPPPRPPKVQEVRSPEGRGQDSRSQDSRSPDRNSPDRNSSDQNAQGQRNLKQTEEDKQKNKLKAKKEPEVATAPVDADKKGPAKGGKFKEFRDVKPPVKRQDQSRFDGRDKQGLRETEEEGHRRRRRAKQSRFQQEDLTIRPTTLKVRIPISIKDLASEMKLKASQLIAKLFIQGLVVTLNDLLEDETTIQLLGNEFGCEIEINTAEEERIRVTDKTIKEEIALSKSDELKTRPPVVAFMGHVDHGKTSLIDAIRKSNRASGEAGAITQHIGAFRCSTAVGDIAILDTPGHEAFSAMRTRGADVTDIVVLVIAGDEGIRQQTIEAMNQAKAANVTIVIAINKCDKPNFNVENVYRQLAENELLPEAWGGQVITINCSAVTGEGIPQLLEMLALQAEILELKADASFRARGTVLESELHKGMGSIATVLVQNGTLNCGDAVVFGQHWGKIKTMRNEFNQELRSAGPSTPVEITGLSGLPEAGEEFIVVKSEKEARAISEARAIGIRQVNFLQTKKISMDNLVQQAGEATKKVLNLIIRTDVQGSLEALKSVLMKITSTKAELNIISASVGEVSESDVQLAATSKAVILGFHTQVESHADALTKELGVQVRLHDIIYHAVDDMKLIMRGLLDKIAQENEKGKAEVKATFKSSHHGVIAGCIVVEGSIHRAHSVRLKRGNELIWKGTMSSLKRVKEDVREVVKGLECGIVLNNFNEALEGDVIETYETIYITQEL